MTAVVHIIGFPAQVGSIRRQRCAWCGALLDEMDFSRVAWSLNDDGTDPGPPPYWPVGDLIEVDGGVQRVIDLDELPDHPDDPESKKIPDNCCATLDTEVTK